MFVLAPAANELPNGALAFALIGWGIVMVAITSVINSVLLARIGREMDKPMWRVADDRDAFRLFFGLWFLIGLLILLYGQIVGPLIEGGDVTAEIVFVSGFCIWAALLHVMGAFVMFYGRPHREEISQAFSTLGHHVAPVGAIVLVGLLGGLLLKNFEIQGTNLASTNANPAAQVAIHFAVSMLGGAADALVGCYIFAYAWLVCIFHRDHFEEPSDDFDF